MDGVTVRRGDGAMNAEPDTHAKDKHLLIAVDQSENAKRAVLYVADFLGGFPGFRATLLSVIPEPEADFFENEAAQAAWLRERIDEANRTLERYRQVLVQSGFPPDKVQIRSCVGGAKALAETILEFQCEMSCCTVVVGRGHKSKSEEFIVGSLSNQLIHQAKNCAVWVVE